MRAWAPPLHFVAGLASAVAGHLLAGHDATTSLAHAPHQLLLAAPLSLGILLVTREEQRDWVPALLLAAGGLVAGDALLALV